jgi:hypothetical protein
MDEPKGPVSTYSFSKALQKIVEKRTHINSKHEIIITSRNTKNITKPTPSL